MASERKFSGSTSTHCSGEGCKGWCLLVLHVCVPYTNTPELHRHRSRTGTFSSSSLSSTQPLIMRQDSSVFTPGSGQQQFIFPLPAPSMSASTTSSSNEDSKQTACHPSTAVPLAHSVAPIGHDYINSKGLVFMEDVHNFALQIACGLQHLASMQVGYGDTFFRMHQIWLYTDCSL